MVIYGGPTARTSLTPPERIAIVHINTQILPSLEAATSSSLSSEKERTLAFLVDASEKVQEVFEAQGTLSGLDDITKTPGFVHYVANGIIPHKNIAWRTHRKHYPLMIRR